MADRRKKKKKGFGLIIFLLLILLMGGGLFFVANHYLSKINRVQEVVPVSEDFETEENEGLDEMNPEDVEWGEIAPLMDDDLLNILLVGQDRRPGEGRQRSDTMIVCSINAKTKKISMISFLRDLYVQIPGHSDNRLNAAYVFGGFPLLKDTLKTNFGITVDGCFEVDFNGFTALIDEINGVDISLTAAEARVVGGGTVEGENHLNGELALRYARIRKIDSDFQRTNRQRKVLLACYEKVKRSSLKDMLSLLDQSLPYLTTDMSNTQIYAIMTKLFSLFGKVEINTYHIPPDGTYTNVYIRGMAVLYPDLKAIRDILADQYMPF